MSEYCNPVKRGFSPDPSVICVGNDFYMVNSSFQYFPAIPISHSKDMVHWHTIGYALTSKNYLDLKDIQDSHGIWAPDIEYMKNKFYITATLRLNGSEPSSLPLRRQLIVSSKTPEGPYCTPSWIEIDNIDPSLFWDKQTGKVYMLIAPGVRIVELSEDLTKTVGEVRQIWKGTGERCPEGPHLFFKDGYYYALVAEGGTGYAHQINVARSKNLFGPYEECPYNPVMKQKDETALIQRAGHGKLVKSFDGTWWCYYLCSRQNEGKWTTLGRETALDPVFWTQDGWPLINKGKGPSERQTAPKLPSKIYKENDICHFEKDTLKDTLDEDFFFVRSPCKYSLLERKGHLRLFASAGNVKDICFNGIVAKRVRELNFSCTTCVEFSPEQKGQEAGLVCYYSTNTYIKLALAFVEKRSIIVCCNKGQGEETVCVIPIIPSCPVELKIVVQGQKRQFFYATKEKNEKNEQTKTYKLAGTIEPCTFLSDEGVPNQKKRHTGTLIGLYCAKGDTQQDIAADFEYFDVEY